MLPALGLIDQVTVVLDVPVTVAVKSSVWPEDTVAVPGFTVTSTAAFARPSENHRGTKTIEN
jgi:hypothetical protein